MKSSYWKLTVRHLPVRSRSNSNTDITRQRRPALARAESGNLAIRQISHWRKTNKLSQKTIGICFNWQCYVWSLFPEVCQPYVMTAHSHLSTRWFIITGPRSFRRHNLINMQFVYTKLCRSEREIMLYKVLSEFPNYVLPLPCNICIYETSWDGLINVDINCIWNKLCHRKLGLR